MTRGRYRTLDAWRGVAAFAVVAFHCTNTFATRDSWIGSLLLSGWMGVFVFFPISGYCVFAAVSRQENATVGHFLHRRWRRIFPPYWASAALAIAVALAAQPLGRQATEPIRLSAAQWFSVATLTQVFTARAGAINPVYWSLCYEEQFYVIVALLLAFATRTRCWIVLAIGVLAAGYGLNAWPDRLRLSGLFLEYWLPFSGGIGVYLWLERPAERTFAVLVLALLGASALWLRNPALTVSFVSSLLFVILAPIDSRMASASVGRALINLGLMSYSLYLVHVPIGGRVVNLLTRTALPRPWIALAGIAASVGAGWAFYQLVERRFVNTAAPAVVSAAPRTVVAAS